jgi:hypothetical protein
MLTHAEIAAPPAWRRRYDSERSAELLTVVEDYMRLLRSLKRPRPEIELVERRLSALRKLREHLVS